jgi:hypothetical protein
MGRHSKGGEGKQIEAVASSPAGAHPAGHPAET